MLSLSLTTGHAIRAMACLAEQEGQQLLISKIARTARVPAPYLAKVVGRLKRAGLVQCKRGQRGGIWLARPPEKISLLDICNAVEGPGSLCSCLLGPEDCSDSRNCPAHTFWKKQRSRIEAELKSNSLADMAAFYLRRKKTDARTRARR